MKKMMKTLVFVAAAAMGLTACQNDFEEQIEAKDSVVVTFVADSADSRTSVDTSGDKPAFAWGENETFAVLEQTTALATATAVTYAKDEEGKAEITATFDNNAGQAEYNYVTVYPATGYVSAEGIEAATLTLPAEQTMAEGSYDPNADLMVSKVLTTTEQPTEVKPLQFTRLAAVAKMSFKGFADGAEKVESVTFTTAEGVNIAGTFSTDLTNPVEFTTAEGVNSVTVTAPEGGVSDVYFTLLPTTLEAGDSYSITVITDKKIYKREATISEGKELEFAAGMVTRFGVDLTKATVSDKWVLVRDASTLKEGDVVIVAAKDYSNAMSTSVNTSSTKLYHEGTEITKVGDNYIVNPSNTVKQHTLYCHTDSVFDEKDAEGNVVARWYRFDFYSEGQGFLHISTNGKANLTTQPYCDNNTLFYFAIDGETGDATVVAKDSEHVDRTYMRYYTDNYFACTGEDKGNAICIYRLVGKEGTIPTVDASVDLPDEDEFVVVAEAGAANDTVISEVKFNYVGDWTITATSEAEWLTSKYDEAQNSLTYTAEANEGEVRYATVTVSATLNEVTKTLGTFNVLQRGPVPTKISIAEFKTKSVNPNVVYQITGKLTTLGNKSGNSQLSDPDGKVAYVKYIAYGEKWLVEENVVQLGDVVTVNTTVTSSSGYGGNSTYPASYVGHYRLTATPRAASIDYLGGELIIDVATLKNGEVEVPTTISGEMTTESEGIEFAYDGGDTATLSFTQNDAENIREATVTFTCGETSVELEFMQDVNPNMTDGKWCLVTDASTLQERDLVIIAAQGYDMAASTTISSSGRRTATPVTTSGNYLVDPSDAVQKFVLVNGSVAGTFAFYDEVQKGFVASTGTGAYMKNLPYYDANSSFAISIESGVTTIANTAESAYPKNKMGYNDSSSYFYCGTSNYQAVCLYKLNGSQGEIPVIDAYVTTPENAVVFETDGTAPEEDGVTFNYVGDWTITASANKEWLTVTYADGKLSYNVQANTAEKREATVTISATREGTTKEIGSFNVIQRSAPIEVTLADFMTKGKDLNTTYRFTGMVEKVPTSKDSDYTITDGTNDAKVSYLYTESGDNVYNNKLLAVGDIVTVHTVVTTTTKGKGGSSTYHSTYIGHYNFTAKADSTNVVSYEGDSVTISVATTGNLQPEGVDIVGSVTAGGEYATLTYTPDGTSATVTFAANNGYPREATVTFSYGATEPISVTIAQESHPSVAWYLVEDVNELAEGDKVIIVALDSNHAVGVLSSTSPNTHPAEAITKGDGQIQSVSTDVQQYILEKGSVDNTWAFKGTLGKENYYIYSTTATSRNLKIRSSINSNASWTIEIDSTTSAATLTSNYTSRILQYNSVEDDFDTQKAADVTGLVCIYKYDQRQ